MNNGIMHAFRKLFGRKRMPAPAGMRRVRRNVNASAEAFTLVELLCAMAILMVIVLLMSMIFEDTERAWALGTGRAENNMSGRAALNLLAHDLQYGVADDLLTFSMRKDRLGLTTYDSYYETDEICVVSLQDSSADGLRTAREVYYWVEEQPGFPYRFQLMRGIYTNALCDMPYVYDHSYSNALWYDNPRPGGPGATDPGTNSVIGVNVAAFGAMAPDGNGVIVHDYLSSDPVNEDRMPEYIDVYIETLTDRDAKRAASVMNYDAAACHDFIKKNARRYATRVYFHNRLGYKAR